MSLKAAPAPIPHRRIVLIGPLAAGKTTVARALAELLEVPLCSVDEVRSRYFDEIGYDGGEAERRFAAGVTPAQKLAYGMPFEVQTIERIMADPTFGVIDFGASNSVYEDDALLARVESALAGSHVVLLLPSEDPLTSEHVLTARLAVKLHDKGEDVSDELLALNAYFVRHPTNRRLAKQTIYTRDLPPSAVATTIIRAAGASPKVPSG